VTRLLKIIGIVILLPLVVAFALMVWYLASAAFFALSEGLLPIVALCFSLGFLVLVLLSKASEPGQISCFIAFAAWAAYAAYEAFYIPTWRATFTDGPIRIDLIFIAPALAVTSITALVLRLRR
jgi:hypothetical protein